MNPFFSKLTKRCQNVDSLLCIGIDPENSNEDLLQYSANLIEQTIAVAAAYKFNSAFFEAQGPSGMHALQKAIAMIPAEIPVILDAKRGDIGSTAKAYAKAAFEVFGAGALTVNPYLGIDALEPFLAYEDRGIFVLARTSNPGAGLFQEAEREVPLYSRVVRALAGREVAFVVGATTPHAVAEVRHLAKEAWILAPGVGVQGGDLEAVLRAGLRADGLGLLLPVSRAIAGAENPALAARELHWMINRIRSSTVIPATVIPAGDLSRTTYADRTKQIPCGDDVARHCGDDVTRHCGDDVARHCIARGLIENQIIQLGAFTLKSGELSPIYMDLRKVPSFPKLWGQITAALASIYQKNPCHHIAGIPLGGVPLASALAIATKTSLLSPRKELKSYGASTAVEGVFQANDTVCVVDDVISTGASKLENLERFSQCNLAVKEILVVIDRRPNSTEPFSLPIRALFTMHELVKIWQEDNLLPAATIEQLLGAFPR